MIVLDTNVVSELMRPDPSPPVVAWVQEHDAVLVTSTITVAEIGYGIARLPEGNRRQLLGSVAVEVFSAFRKQVLPFDAAAADRYGDVVVTRERAGIPVDGFDAQIASICLAHAAALATRNTKDFLGLGLDLIDPWDASTEPQTSAMLLDRAARRSERASASAFDSLDEARSDRDTRSG